MSGRRRYGFVKPHLIGLFSLVDSLGSLTAALARALRPPTFPAPPSRILLVNFAHLGDVLMITPAIRAVRAAYPEAHLAALVGPWSKDLLAANPYLDEVLVFRPSWWDRDKGAYLRPVEIVDLVHLLREGQFDVSINFKSFFQENLALWLARVPARVGYGIFGGGFFLTRQSEYDWTAHTVERNLALVDCGLPRLGAGGESQETFELDAVGADLKGGPNPRGGGIRLTWQRASGRVGQMREGQPAGMAIERAKRRNAPEMFVFDEDMKAAEDFLAAELASGDKSSASQPLVAFHIGAGYPSKLWGEERYAALAGEMGTRWRARILVVGGADDLPLIARMQQLSGQQLVVAAGKLGIRQTAALISLCHLFVGNDSGPAHLAAAIGVPSIAIFSGENEAAVWRPYADNSVAIQRRPDCWPCGKKICDRDHSCMTDITIEEVLAAAERVLGWVSPP